MTRPALLLDIDDTLNPDLRALSPNNVDLDYRMVPDWLFNGRPVWYSPGIGAALRAVHERTGCELIWATRWNDLANRVFGPLMGLPELPQAPTHPALGKPETILPWLGHRPFVWLDDEQYVIDAANASPYGAGVKVSAGVGVRQGHLDEAENKLTWLMSQWRS